MSSPQVRLVDIGPRDGLVRGECGRYHWEARLARGKVSYGLDPDTLYKGHGRIARLVLYETIHGTHVQRKVAAYDMGWQFGRQQYIRILQHVARYLDRV
jgi:hypothetical protein